MAAPRPTASAIGGVPASYLCGSSAYVDPAIVTSSIISPPPRNGGGAPRRFRPAPTLAAAEERREDLEQLTTSPQHADAGGTTHLVAGEGDRVDTERLHVDAHVR